MEIYLLYLFEKESDSYTFHKKRVKFFCEELSKSLNINVVFTELVPQDSSQINCLIIGEPKVLKTINIYKFIYIDINDDLSGYLESNLPDNLIGYFSIRDFQKRNAIIHGLNSLLTNNKLKKIDYISISSNEKRYEKIALLNGGSIYELIKICFEV